MLNKILYLIIFIVVIVCFTQTLLVGSYLIGKSNECSQIIKKTMIDVFPSIYQNGLKSSIYFSGQYKCSNKIDLVMCNHINTFDFMIYLSIIRKYDDRDIYFIAKKSLAFVPGIGAVFMTDNDIILNRNIDDDKNNILSTIKKIKLTGRSSIIIILPEGTRYTPKKYNTSLQFCKDNNLHQFNNILYPKMKGLWTICNLLIEEKCMGNIIDISMIIENIRKCEGYIKDTLTKNLGDTLNVITTYEVPIDGRIMEYDNFKNWFIEIWKNKDNTLENMLTKNDINIYQRIDDQIKYSTYIILVLTISLFCYLIYSTNGMYIPISFLITTIVSMIGYNKK